MREGAEVVGEVWLLGKDEGGGRELGRLRGREVERSSREDLIPRDSHTLTVIG